MDIWTYAIENEFKLKNWARKRSISDFDSDDLYQSFLIKMWKAKGQDVDNAAAYASRAFCNLLNNHHRDRTTALKHIDIADAERYLTAPDFQERDAGAELYKLSNWYKQAWPKSKQGHKVMDSLASGLTLKEVAKQQNIAYDTVKAHLRRAVIQIRGVNREIFST